jgi:hypothetical protein
MSTFAGQIAHINFYAHAFSNYGDKTDYEQTNE